MTDTPVSETFVAEVLVAGRTVGLEEQLAVPARAWFGGPVRLVRLEVSLREHDGLVRYVVRGSFQAVSTVKRSRLETVAMWLGVRTSPNPTFARPPKELP